MQGFKLTNKEYTAGSVVLEPKFLLKKKNLTKDMLEAAQDLIKVYDKDKIEEIPLEQMDFEKEYTATQIIFARELPANFGRRNYLKGSHHEYHQSLVKSPALIVNLEKDQAVLKFNLDYKDIEFKTTTFGRDKIVLKHKGKTIAKLRYKSEDIPPDTVSTIKSIDSEVLYDCTKYRFRYFIETFIYETNRIMITHSGKEFEKEIVKEAKKELATQIDLSDAFASDKFYLNLLTKKCSYFANCFIPQRECIYLNYIKRNTEIKEEYNRELGLRFSSKNDPFFEEMRKDYRNLIFKKKYESHKLLHSKCSFFNKV